MTQKTRSRSRKRRSTGAPSGQGDRDRPGQGDRNRSNRKSRSKGSSRGRSNGHSREGDSTVNTLYRQPMGSGRGSRAIVANFEDLFAQHGAEVKAIATRLREIVMEALPDAEERVHVSLKIALYHQPTEVCGIQAVNKFCNLFFSNGGRMNDPDGLLEGAGPVRHVKVRTLEDLPAEGLKNLILEARKLVR